MQEPTLTVQDMILAVGIAPFLETIPVSYTHLDVYKRQKNDSPNIPNTKNLHGN